MTDTKFDNGKIQQSLVEKAFTFLNCFNGFAAKLQPFHLFLFCFVSFFLLIIPIKYVRVDVCEYYIQCFSSSQSMLFRETYKFITVNGAPADSKVSHCLLNLQ